MDKTVVFVSRLWENPEIKIEVTDKAIGLSVNLEDFLVALGKEVGNPTFLITQQMLAGKLKSAAATVVQQMKAESARGM